MSQIDDLFSKLRAEGKKAFMPFVTAGDPDLDFTADVIEQLDQCGCSMCEVGIPYSDPVADGPVIQSSYTRALNNQIKLKDIFAALNKATAKSDMPIVMMVSYAIVFRHGLQDFISHAKAAGVSGAIIPDLPVEEANEMTQICKQEDFSLIQLITPTTPRERALEIAKQTTGFIYYVSVTGITGERSELPKELAENVQWLKSQTDLPICIGFGINQADQMKTLAPLCDGLIVGSAMVRRVAKASELPREEVLADLKTFASELVDAIN